MGVKEGVKFRSGSAFMFFSVLFFFVGTAARGEELYTPYTRTDELSCGNTLVQASTTCDVETDTLYSSVCTEQHFLFFDRTTGASVTVKTSAKHDRRGILYGGLAVDWACFSGKAGSFVVIGYGSEGNCEICGWDEVFDVNGRRIATNERGTDEEMTRYERKWHSLGLPEPWPWAAFVPIQIFREDRKFSAPDERTDEKESPGTGTGASAQKKPSRKAKWLVFSSTKYRHERQLVIKHMYITRSDLKDGKKVYIALADLNGDGTPEIFAYVDYWASCGKLGCETNIYQRRGQRLVSLLGPDGNDMFLDIDRKGCQKALGVLPSTTMGFHDVAVDDQTVWKWNGKEYGIVDGK